MFTQGKGTQGRVVPASRAKKVKYCPIPLSYSLSKVPEVTLGFWIIKIFATTLGEVGGNAVTMQLGFGYLIGSAIFAAMLIVLVVAQIMAKRFQPFLYWAVIVATTLTGRLWLIFSIVRSASVIWADRFRSFPWSWRRSAFGIGRSVRSPFRPSSRQK